jgi:hypothetical protein
VGGEAPVTPVSTFDSSYLTFPTNRAITVHEFHEGGDACAHVEAFWKLIDDWDDSPICEDALMLLFSWTLLEGQRSACDWFLIQKDKSIKTIRDFLHDFLERFGEERDEIYDELVDDFMEKWKGTTFKM